MKPRLRVVALVRQHRQFICADLSADGKTVALGDTAGWTEVAAGTLGTVRSYSFSGDGKRLAVGGLDRQRNAHFVRVLDPATGNELSALTLSRPVGDIALNADGALLAIAGGLGTSQFEIWDLKTRSPARVLRGHSQSTNGVMFSPDGRLASCSWDNTIKFWNAAAGQQVSRISGPSGLLAMPIALAPGGEMLAYGQRNSVNLFTGPVKTVTLVDAATGRIRRTLAGHDGSALCLAFSSDGARLVSGGRKGDMKVWNNKTGKPITTVRGGAN